eukprot:TRINITY_DN3585_c4_g1_i1.p1 TRINITY_DN3585_c4_g1~~TRINITY_DN3585_c4_g1_i1.p1  ORF type:complete len:391 (+),score=37.06 TRINITY_DN3585_c4_g1_i1:49-1173(+)
MRGLSCVVAAAAAASVSASPTDQSPMCPIADDHTATACEIVMFEPPVITHTYCQDSCATGGMCCYFYTENMKGVNGCCPSGSQCCGQPSLSSTGCCPDDKYCCYEAGCTDNSTSNQCCSYSNTIHGKVVYSAFICEGSETCCGSGSSQSCCDLSTHTCCGDNGVCCPKSELCVVDKCIKPSEVCGTGACTSPNVCYNSSFCAPPNCTYAGYDLWSLSSQARGEDTPMAGEAHGFFNPCGPLLYTANRTQWCGANAMLCPIFGWSLGSFPPKYGLYPNGSLWLASSSWNYNTRTSFNMTFVCGESNYLQIAVDGEYPVYLFTTPAVCGGPETPVTQSNLNEAIVGGIGAVVAIAVLAGAGVMLCRARKVAYTSVQ